MPKHDRRDIWFWLGLSIKLLWIENDNIEVHLNCYVTTKDRERKYKKFRVFVFTKVSTKLREKGCNSKVLWEGVTSLDDLRKIFDGA